MASKRGIKVGGKELKDLVFLERATVLERTPGKGYLSGVIKVSRSGTLYLLVPVKVRDALNFMGIDLKTYIGRGNNTTEVIVTCDKDGEELRLEYSFKKAKGEK